MHPWTRPLLADSDPLKLLAELLERNVIEQFDVLPAFDRATPLTVVSDYAGASRRSRVHTYSFYVFQPEACTSQLTALAEIRRDLKADRRVRYSRIKSDGVAAHLLARFMEVWKQIPSLLFTIAVDKGLAVNPGPNDPAMHPEFEKRIAVFDERVRPHVVNIGSLFAFVHAGLVSPGQACNWISDSDDVIPNAAKRGSFYDIVGNALGQMARQPIGDCTMYSASERHRVWEDALSIPDVASGSTAEAMTQAMAAHPVYADGVWRETVVESRAAAIAWALQNLEGKLLHWIFQFREGPPGRLERVIRWKNNIRDNEEGQTVAQAV